MDNNLISRTRLFAARHQLEIDASEQPLGSGKDGIIMVAQNKVKPGKTAIKFFKDDEGYWREKRVYERLKAKGVRLVNEFNTPQFLSHDNDLLAIQMTIVKRPFVLDFASAHLDRRPDFDQEIWDNWEADIREKFEDRWQTVKKILDVFEDHGVYLLDVSPGNIGFPNP